MQAGSARAQSVTDTRNRILDVALDVLGENPDAGVGDIATAAGVVRRTVYGHFPARLDLVRTLTRRAVGEFAATLAEAESGTSRADTAWAEFVAHLWPLAHRYRVLVALRRGEYGPEIHALLGPVDASLGDLVRRGQTDGLFTRHLPAEVLSQIAFAAVFSVADRALDQAGLDSRAAVLASLLVLGVPEARATALADGRAGSSTSGLAGGEDQLRTP